uniref:Fructose-bisphosphate aldolase n=1 Tax=Rhodosorus marinus TaxID=101924 RepID=A0A7S0BLR4_9RHOD|mmetsp:Transcript_2140/g.3173  ORF Transcript_2140/g.3173 Transcript_2140/m.3173 type:complete len:407 (+) Transcript_2140:109-1329(+)
MAAFVSSVGFPSVSAQKTVCGRKTFSGANVVVAKRNVTGPMMAMAIGRKGSVENFADELKATAAAIASPGKGILAVDESTKTIGKRLSSIGVENTEENRQAYRGLLFNCPGLGEYISGAILFEETLYQNSAEGKPFVECLNDLGIIPGIKVDKGLSPLGGAESFETWCTGLDGLAERAAAYYKQGARFAKWRAVLQISPSTPSKLSLTENCWGLARYAKTCQDAGLVPIIEPEILMDGDHDIARCAEVQEEVLATVYRFCELNGVYLEGSLLKPNMTVPGADFDGTTSPEEIGEYTIRTLQRHVPSSVPGIMFLSGGMSEEEASVNLSAMNSIERKGPWSLSFSYGRALQQSCLKSWLGKEENVPAAQEALLARARANSQANLGKYKPGSEKSLDAQGTFEKGYKY